MAALEHGAHVVVGTSGLTESDFAQIAIQKVSTLVGVHRGLDSVLDLWGSVERRELLL